jgi:peroxiredoxin
VNLLSHLIGRRMPSVDLEATSGSPVNLGKLLGPAVVFCYPYTGRPGYADPPNWDHIPGAHGSTPQARVYSETYGQFRRLGIKLYGLSFQDTEWQREFVTRNRLSYRLLTDAPRGLSSRLGLPFFETGGAAYLQRMTFMIHDGVITAMRFPVSEPEKDAETVLEMILASSK